MKRSPNPGSDEAVAAGCECPISDNHYGRGAYEDGKAFWVTDTCPLHGKPTTSQETVRLLHKPTQL